MIHLRELRAGVRVFAAHMRNTRGMPDRIWWVLHRTMRAVLSAGLPGMLERHTILPELYSDYPEWIARYDTLDESARAAMLEQIAAMHSRPTISILMPTRDADPRELREAVDSVRRQLYPHWELCVADDGSTDPLVPAYLQQLARADPRIRCVRRNRSGGIARATNEALELATGDYVGFLDHDDVLSEQALFRIVEAINARSDAVLLYSDEDKLDAVGRRHSPHFKPDWNAEWIRTTNYVLHFCVVKTTAAREVGGMNPAFDGAQDWDFVLRIAERCGDACIVHVPHVLYHWRVRAGSTAAGLNQKKGIEAVQRGVIEAMLARRGLFADVEPSLSGWWIRYRVPEPGPLVSIVMPASESNPGLRQSIDSLVARTAYGNFEVIVVDHGLRERTDLQVPERLTASGRVTVLPCPGTANYSTQCNLGVTKARGMVVVLLESGIEPIDAHWLEELLGHVLQPDVGLVGALLLSTNNTIAHAGVLLGVNGTSDRPYRGYRRGYGAVAGRALAAQDVTALDTACVAVRRDRYLEVGGMDDSLAVCHHDLDLSLRFVERGYRNVWTPHAELHCRQGPFRRQEGSAEHIAQAAEEAKRFRARWSTRLVADPFYNPNLACEGTPYTLAFPPRTRSWVAERAH